MKTLGKVLILLTVIALVLVPVLSCKQPIRQIVVTWNPFAGPTHTEPATHFSVFGPYASAGIVDVTRGLPVRIKGACFDPGDEVILTICKDNILLDLWGFDFSAWDLFDTKYDIAIANDCGAFEVFTFIPLAVPLGPVSVRAWIDMDGDGILDKDELQACWPLDIWPEDLWKLWYDEFFAF